MQGDTLHFSGGFNVGFDINMQSNPTDSVKMIGVDATVSRSCLGYSCVNLTSGICSLFKHAAMDLLPYT